MNPTSLQHQQLQLGRIDRYELPSDLDLRFNMTRETSRRLRLFIGDAACCLTVADHSPYQTSLDQHNSLAGLSEKA